MNYSTCTSTSCYRQSLVEEAQSHSLRHENIVQLLGVVAEHGHYGVVLEFVIHGSLDEFISQYTVSVL